MNGATTQYDDQYMSTLIPVQDAFGPLENNYYITKISAVSDGKVHHIIVDGCGDKIHKKSEAKSTDYVSCQNKAIIYAWALQALLEKV